MSVQRSPPNSNPVIKTPSPRHYGSDSALNKTSNENKENSCTNITKRQKRTFNEVFDHAPISTDEIKVMLTDLTNQMGFKFESLTSAVNDLTNKHEKMSNSFQFMSSKYDDLLLKINSVMEENTTYKKRINILENKLEQLQKNSLKTKLEIRNVPKQKDEDKKELANIIKNIGTVLCLDTPIQDYEISDSYRTKSETIVVDLTTVNRKETIISTYKSFNKAKRVTKEPQLNSNHLKLPGSSKSIFISESLTDKAQRLYYVARGYVKNKKIAAAWTSYGKVYIKKDEGVTPIRIE